MTRMTAEQARDLARSKDTSAAVETILLAIEEAAGNGKYKITTRAYGFGGGAYYTQEANWPEFGKAIISELKALGYRCDVRCHEGQFVDMWLEVSWEEERP